MRPRITEFGDMFSGGWYWAVEYDGLMDDRVERRFRTNKHGEGLWQDGRQILGTCQFSLPSDRKRARAKIYRLFVRQTDDFGMSL